ncbi:transcriptional regulator, TetR family [Shewanella halifaxensis HAW-EB4]|uniref:Transcriptional regulator, TetR family n=1 Tax=Shewanella halifaxensis (strain HAW-EB4) TaxID=458817 RepID=B0TSF7_SHEHH|nr:TetR/AcrR family transcriptional regulator [Shewanella halifaxensis]ABZ76537.1 transcriptional regulator, TetR family [Shewanella halifaxensis HAW-EB4]
MTRSEQKRLAIINAAKEEFIHHGFIAANMDRICTTAEVSKRTLYRHYESKEKLFESVLTIIQASIDETLTYPFNPELSLYEQLKAITYLEVDTLYNICGMALARTILLEFLRQPDMARKLVTTIYSTKAVTHWFSAAMDSGKLKQTDLRIITNVYTSLFQGELFWPQVIRQSPIPEGKELEEKVETVVMVVLRAFEA